MAMALGKRIAQGGARRRFFLLITSMQLIVSLVPSLFAARALSLAPLPFGSGRSTSTSTIGGDIHSSSSLAFTFTPRATRWLQPFPGAHSPICSTTADLSQGRSGRIMGGSAGLVSRARSAITRSVVRWRRSVVRAMSVLSLLFISLSIGMSWSRPAHAAWGKADSVVTVAAEACDQPSMGRKIVKLCAVAGAVAAGVATANKVRAFDDGDGEDDIGTGGNVAENTNLDIKEGTIPMEDPSLPPLSSEWIEQQLQETKDDMPNPAEHEEMAEPLSSEWIEKKEMAENEDTGALVKDLDSKIEMLRAREEQAKASAERKRLQDIERAAEARKQEQVEIDAKIAAFERQQRMEQERIDAIKREKANRERRERERRLAELERGRREQSRLERRDKGSDNTPPDIERMRRQPKPEEEERKLKEKYGGMDLEERAFNILVDLGMVDVHSDPATLDLDEDDEYDEYENNAFM